MLSPHLANTLHAVLLLVAATGVLLTEWRTSTSLLALVPIGLLLLVCSPYIRRRNRLIYRLVLFNTALVAALNGLHLQAHQGLSGLHFGLSLMALGGSLLALVSLAVGLGKRRKPHHAPSPVSTPAAPGAPAASAPHRPAAPPGTARITQPLFSIDGYDVQPPLDRRTQQQFPNQGPPDRRTQPMPPSDT